MTWTIPVHVDAWLPPQARFFVGSKFYVGVALYAEMLRADTWPAWARAVFWEVT